MYVIKLKSQPNTPKIQRLSLSLLKPFLLDFYVYKQVPRTNVINRQNKTFICIRLIGLLWKNSEVTLLYIHGVSLASRPTCIIRQIGHCMCVTS